MPGLYMLIGLPGSGKTTYAKSLVERRGDITHVSSDEIRTKLFGSGGFTKEDQAVVFDEVHKTIIDLLKDGHDVIYDATNLIRKYRVQFLKKLEGIDCRKLAVLFMDTLDNLKSRNMKREDPVPDGIYDRMIRLFDPPWYREGFDVIEIEWPRRNYNMFPYDDKGILRFISHENHHHKLTIGDHMEKATEVFNEIWGGTHSYAKQAIKYHDIGKPLVKAFANRKGEKTEEAHYYQHENVGSYLYLLIAHNSNILVSDWDALYVSNLINLHMRPINAWRKSPRAMHKDKDLYGPEMFGDLIRIYIADVLSEEGG